MTNARSLRQPLSLRLTSASFLVIWCLIAAFPIFWITIMSVKLPIDAFNANPLNVIFGPTTLTQGKGLSFLDITIGLAVLVATAKLSTSWLVSMVNKFSPSGFLWAGWIIGSMTFGLLFIIVFFGILPTVLSFLNNISGVMGTNIIGFSSEHYATVWLEKGFIKNFQNSLLVTTGVVTISLTFGTLAGYGLSRSGSNLAFWILIIALIFRALPHSVLVTGYLPFFMNSAEILRPIFGDSAPTLYGMPWATIAVLVAINQPFTIWMLRSFFQSIPAELDEAARVDGCSHFQAFRRVIMPVMWPGVITTGLFSFLLGYNDFLVTSLLLEAQNTTMVPAIAGMFNMETTTTDQVVAVAAAVSIIAPLFFLVMFFQRQIVTGLTAGAVKG
jgi:multiple sugar transport system permease protein